MGGGRGTRLYPLTKDRCKPAVPLCGKYRLVDIPISNCLHSGFNRIFVLTQFNTASLHHHIQESYKFDPFGGAFVDILAAEQTDSGQNWYQGTADAVRQNLHHYRAEDDDLFLILSGDQLYSLDFSELIKQHEQSGADLTVAAKAMPASEVTALGVMEVDDQKRIQKFVEKPKDPAIIESLHISDKLKAELADTSAGDYCLASMGIYVFNKKLMFEALESCDKTDFGKEIIPDLLGKIDMRSYIFEGYWEDIGTVRSFWEANLTLCDKNPPFDFYEEGRLVYTRARFLPPAKVYDANLSNVVLAGGVFVSDGASVTRSVLGVRSQINQGSSLENVVMMGQDFFDKPEAMEKHIADGEPHTGIGKNCKIRNAIIDKNARIGDNCILCPEGVEDMWEENGIMVRDGVINVMKNAVVPAGTVVGKWD